MAVLLAACAGVLAQPAKAAFPGKNGKIAFVSNRDTGAGEIYAMKPDGTGVTRLTFPTGGNGDPAFSPDGTKVAFKNGGNDIYVMSANGMNPDGTGAQRITNTPVVESDPTFSPDGSRIAFVASAFEVDGSQDFEIWVMNADGTGRTLLTNNTFPDTQPAWSPSGDKIAFVSERRVFGDTDSNIYVMNADGSGQTNVTTNTTDNPPYQGNDNDPTWSPDGSKIAYVHTFAPNASGVPNIWTMDPNGAGKTNVSNNPLTSAIMPTWSPDGSKIAYVGVASGTTDRNIYAMNADGTGQGVLHANAANDVRPDWQQDSILPETTVTSGPASITNTTSASLAFVSSETGSTFECSVDGAPFSACTSPKSYSGLAAGPHTFRVRATDAAGNADATPASRAWTVDTTAPSGRVAVNGGAAYTRTAAVSLALSASDAGGVSSMRFSNDGANWTAWGPYATTKAWTLAGANGTKTVHVQYRDRAGNASAIARDTIIFDNTPPTVSGMSPTNGSVTTDTSPTIRAIVRDNLTDLQKANVKLYVNGAQISPTAYSYTASTDALVYNSPAIARGTKTIKVVATDAAGNVRSASWSFTIR